MEKVKRHSCKVFSGLLLAFLLQGCTAINYYSQLIGGPFDLMGRAEPIDKMTSREKSAPELREALKMAISVRNFASSELALPDKQELPNLRRSGTRSGGLDGGGDSGIFHRTA